ncbi:MAG: serine/threonine protein [Planctomycetota bacterium]|nr:MAG: serine/threonine protein [Planctomycetota bacterium]
MTELGLNLKTGDLMGPWTLQGKIDRGGNAEVWRAVRDGGLPVALKILTRHSSEARDRFLREIETQRKLQGHKGVMPLLGAGKLDRDSGESLLSLSMPIAVPSHKALSGLKEPRRVVEATLSFARTLAELASKGVFHRDIKPANLFQLGESWVVGDFGLARDTSKPRSTHSHTRRGPREFTAPEAIKNPMGAEDGPSDLWSLAKTLWVLLAEERFPPPGHHVLSDPLMTLSTKLKIPGIEALDSLIARCTENDPRRRPTLAVFTRALEAWLARPETSPRAPSVKSMIQDFVDLSAAGEEAANLRNLRQREGYRLLALAERFTEQLHSQLLADGQDANLCHRFNPNEVSLSSRRDNEYLHGLAHTGVGLWNGATAVSWMAFNDSLSPMLVLYLGLELVDPQRIVLRGGIRLSGGMGFSEIVANYEIPIPADPAEADLALHAVEQHLAEAFPRGVGQLMAMARRVTGRKPASNELADDSLSGTPWDTPGRKESISDWA